MSQNLTNLPSLRTLLIPLLSVLFLVAVPVTDGQEPPREGQGYTDTPFLPDQPWRVHDRHRPRPPRVEPAEKIGDPPSDAVVLFDGTDLSKWKNAGSNRPPRWKVENGYMEITRGTLETVEQFGDVQLHLEWSAPEQIQSSGQGRGNSGVILMGRYEIQVLDSYNNDTYADGQAASIYGQFPPQVDVNRQPGEWQTFDIIFEAPQFEGEQLVRPAKATVFHNGVLVHHARELIGPMAHQMVAAYQPHPPKGPLVLQDHGNPVRYRNIWIRPLRKEIMPWIELVPQTEKSNGKKVVLISGDEEYRSEEALPMLAEILVRHGFRCVVLFAINPATGSVDPNYTKNIPGLHLLDDADVMVLFTRFRELPDWQMKHIVDFFHRGGAILGLRTSTHAFRYGRNSDSPYRSWSFDSSDWQGGFGQQVLGDTWISHHGHHKVEATRGVIAEAMKESPLLSGVADVFGPTDVYGIAHLPDDAQVLLFGQVLSGMEADSPPVEGPKNDPMMPLAWMRNYKNPQGETNRVFTTTMGASVDLLSEDLRRLLINAVYWGAGLEDQIPERADVSIEGKFEPTFYGFTDSAHFRDQLLEPHQFLPSISK